MAMGVGPSIEDEEVVSTINTTPLVDVMLVLLIIFLITIPVVTTSVPVTLPKERNEIRETKPENITLSVDAAGRIYWNDLRMQSTSALIDRPWPKSARKASIPLLSSASRVAALPSAGVLLTPLWPVWVSQ